MCSNQAKIISYPTDRAENNGQVSRKIDRPEKDFLDKLSQDPGEMDRIRARVNTCLAEMALARDNNDWQRVVDLFYPLEEKEPDLVAMGLDIQVRAELAFALSQAGRPEQSAVEYEKCVTVQPDNFLFVSGLAYVLYNLVYSAKNKERILPPAEKAAVIERAHECFAKAQELRPQGVTSYYRQGMLYKNIQGMDLKAAPLLSRAVKNWEAYDPAMKEKRHQEHKNYVKALYNLSSCLLKQGRSAEALKLMQQCLEEDQNKDFIRPEHKYFALGKIYLELSNPEKAVKDLEYAASFTDPRNGDYIYELWARACLAMEKPMQALQVLGKIPDKFRRQFVLWTEGDCYAALQDHAKARQAWTRSMEKDRRSRHKALIRLARLEFRLGNYSSAGQYAREADRFHLETYHGPKECPTLLRTRVE